MRQRIWLESLSDYDCEIRYHPGKANVVEDALSRKGRIKPLRVRALVMKIGLNLHVEILKAQNEAIKGENYGTKDLCGIIKKLEPRADGTLCLNGRSQIPNHGTQLDMSKAYHPQIDGQSERTIQTLEDMLHACVIDFRKGWDRHLPLIDDKLNFIEEPVEIMDREVKQLKQSRIPIVKVRWNSRRDPKFTWEREYQMKKKYPHLFAKSKPTSESTS
ncbi:putative reverse transcriptase domain-containing protein [Tanacetum coccineum]